MYPCDGLQHLVLANAQIGLVVATCPLACMLFMLCLCFCKCRALPGVNAAAVGLIVAAVFQLGMKVHSNSPIPDASICIGESLCCRARAQPLVSFIIAQLLRLRKVQSVHAAVAEVLPLKSIICYLKAS